MMPKPRTPMGGGNHFGAPRTTAPATASQPSRERTAAEIVRQAGAPSATASQAATQPRTSAPATTPTIRVVDEDAEAEREQQKAWQQAAEAAAAVQREQAMKMAAAAVAATAAPATEDAGPLFVSPRAEAPQQRTLFTAMEPEATDEDAEEPTSSGGGLFNRLANVGRSIAGSAQRPASQSTRTAAATATAERKLEVHETMPRAGDEEEMYDIPAFLRRQAN